jgi:hypothetical protein
MAGATVLEALIGGRISLTDGFDEAKECEISNDSAYFRFFEFT